MTAPDVFSIGVARPVWKCRSDMNTMLAVYGREGAARPGRSKACDLDGRQLRKKSNRSALGNDLRRGCRGAPSLLRSGGAALAWQGHAMTLLAGDTGFYMVRSVSNDLAQAATGRARISKRSGRRQGVKPQG